jgi:hypothetical protein
MASHIARRKFLATLGGAAAVTCRSRPHAQQPGDAGDRISQRHWTFEIPPKLLALATR